MRQLPTKDEALWWALGALERSVATCFDQYAHQQVMSQPDHFINQTIAAINEVLAKPQRTWVGLTDEEIDTWNIVGHESLREFVRAIEAKLKEKNT